ncbi:uncharacterized protein LOC102800825, partial [Saccoglossus kowalevskii]|uniref:Probable serine/threonine-protein kinase DDB_G0288147-like n=1 Tax=Saccoglossus kowalevskii TaxID=10224 RepID=A0ABM0MKV8_SACKO
NLTPDTGENNNNVEDETMRDRSDKKSTNENENQPVEETVPDSASRKNDDETETTINIRLPPNITEESSDINNLSSPTKTHNVSLLKKDSYCLTNWKYGDNINKTINKTQVPYPPDWEAIDSFTTAGTMKRETDTASYRYRKNRRNMVFFMVGLFVVVAIVACAIGVVLEFKLGRNNYNNNTNEKTTENNNHNKDNSDGNTFQ